MFDKVVGPTHHVLTVYVDGFLWHYMPDMHQNPSEFWRDIEYHIYDLSMANWEKLLDEYLAREYAYGLLAQYEPTFSDRV